MKRTLVIGDIHGGLKALEQVLNRAEMTTNDHLIFLGDYVDGWSESAQVIEFLMELDSKLQCDFIYGNHDAWCHDWLRSGEINSNWFRHGGKETIESYQEILVERGEAHLMFFKKMQNFIVDTKNRLFVHAGYSSMHGPVKEHYETNYRWDRTLWEMAVAVHGKVQKDELSFPNRLKLFKEIYIGHTPTLSWNIDHPWNRVNVWNLDTGAAFHGKLSVMDVDTKEYWQSDLVMELYPGEKGRN
ncbi:MAG: serine/threonine protein phosphatase [Flavobacteriales bacterium]|nr:serine/threonine protein phosphatase [Flavobacteriales bacterium]